MNDFLSGVAAALLKAVRERNRSGISRTGTPRRAARPGPGLPPAPARIAPAAPAAVPAPVAADPPAYANLPSPVRLGVAPAPSTPEAGLVQALFTSPQSLAAAFIASEVFAKPVALRDR